MTTPTVASTTVRLVHLVRLRHPATGAGVPLARAALEPRPYGWSVRVRGSDAVVVARDGVAAPAAPPSLRVTVAAPGADRLAAADVVIPLTAPELTVDVTPLPATLAVELFTPGTGAPRTGRTVVARAGSGPNPRPTIALPESTTPGTYRTAPVTWAATFVPLDLLVDGDLLRRITVDLTRAETLVRLADTT